MVIMSETDSQKANGRTAIWNVILSSSIGLAAITGVLYFVGGGVYQGRAWALGLKYLSGLQPNEYIFEGTQISLSYLPLIAFALLIAASALAVGGVHLLVVKHIDFLRRWERWVFVVLILLLTIVWICGSFHTENTATSLVTSVSCPMKKPGFIGISVVAFCACTVMGSLWLFSSKLLRLTFLVWGGLIFVLCLFNLGWASGARQLNDNFPIAVLTNNAAQLLADTRVLVLGADDKNFVVLVKGKDQTSSLQPQYLSRSDVKTFRIVGLAKIDDFVCKP